VFGHLPLIIKKWSEKRAAGIISKTKISLFLRFSREIFEIFEMLFFEMKKSWRSKHVKERQKNR